MAHDRPSERPHHAPDRRPLPRLRATTYHSALRSIRAEGDDDISDGSSLESDITGRLLPEPVLDRLGTHGGVLASFFFVLFAEFGDKTQLLTINLAATFPESPVAVFVGVVAALGLRTGIDAAIGDQVTRLLPTRFIELGAAVVFLGFGLLVLGVVFTSFFIGVLATLALLAVAGLVREH